MLDEYGRVLNGVSGPESGAWMAFVSVTHTANKPLRCLALLGIARYKHLKSLNF